jgi:hypothetical protein
LFIIKSTFVESNPFEKKSIEDDPFIADIMNYAFERNLKTMVMPNSDGQQCIYSVEEDDTSVPICQIYSTTNKQGTAAYNELLKDITDKIDNFIENKVAILSKVKKE